MTPRSVPAAPATLIRWVDDPSARREVDAVAMTDVFLRRVEEVQPATNAFITTTPELARPSARALDARRAREQQRLPLDGMVVAVKDDIDVAGVRCTSGSRFFADVVPEEDAPIVRRLRDAGAVIVGKANMQEFAYGVTCDNPHYGACRNPWDTTRIPGGSSGGSGAALAADCCIAALGSDGGGSVRIPAALNGVTGLRPTLGVVDGTGVFPIVRSFETVGPMARSVADVRAVFAVIRDGPIAGAEGDPPADSLASLRIGVPSNYFFDGTSSDVADAVWAAADVLSRLGAAVEEVRVPEVEQVVPTATIISRAEALAIHWDRFRTSPDWFGDEVRERLSSGLEISGVELAIALERREALRRTLLRVFDAVDVVLTPTTEAVAPVIAESPMIPTTARLTRLTWPWSLAGNPALSLPCGLSVEGLPIGCQLAAAPHCEDILFRVGAAYQEHTPWHRLRPTGVDEAADSGR